MQFNKFIFCIILFSLPTGNNAKIVDNLIASVPSSFPQQRRQYKCSDSLEIKKSRTRGVEKLESKTDHVLNVVDFVKNEINSKTKFEILEFGMGSGNLLLDIRHAIPDPRLTLYGINKNRTNSFCIREDFYDIEKFFKREGRSTLESFPIPLFIDANTQNLGEVIHQNFDLILSQVSILYIDDKVSLIKSFYHLLKPGGSMLLTVQGLLLEDSSIPETIERMRNILKKSGQKFSITNLGDEGFGLFLTKNEKALDLPLKLMKKELVDSEWVRSTYKINNI